MSNDIFETQRAGHTSDYDDLIALGYIDRADNGHIKGNGNSGASGTFATISDVTITEMTAAAKVKVSSSDAADVGEESFGTITQVTGAVKAMGTITFADQPTADDTITINGVAFTFVDADPTGAQILIGENLEETLQNAITVLNASENTDVDDAVYTASATVLTVTHKLYGTGGNSFTLAASAATRSGATLAGGINGIGSIAFISNLYVGDILNINGTEFTMVASGATGNQIDLDTTLSATLDNVVTALNASVVAGVALATYSKTGTNTTLTATYDDSALDGTDFTLDATSLGGTGARTVMVYGLDAEWNPITEVITLNGQTAVETTQEFLHPYLIRVTTAGSGGTNAGIIYVGTGTVTSGEPATKYLGASAGKGISRAAFFPVPKGYNLNVKGIGFSYAVVSSSVLMSFEGCVKPYGGVWESRTGCKIVSGSFYYPIKAPAYPEKTLIKIQASSSGSAAAVDNFVNVRLYKLN